MAVIIFKISVDVQSGRWKTLAKLLNIKVIVKFCIQNLFPDHSDHIKYREKRSIAKIPSSSLIYLSSVSVTLQLQIYQINWYLKYQYHYHLYIIIIIISYSSITIKILKVKLKSSLCNTSGKNITLSTYLRLLVPIYILSNKKLNQKS